MVGKWEIGKDTLQELAESSAGHLGRIGTILADAVRSVAHEVGEWAGDAFEIREAAGRAAADTDNGDTFGDVPGDSDPLDPDLPRPEVADGDR